MSAASGGGAERDKVLRVLHDAPAPMSAAQIAKLAGLDKSVVNSHLYALAKSAGLRKSNDLPPLWCPPAAPGGGAAVAPTAASAPSFARDGGDAAARLHADAASTSPRSRRAIREHGRYTAALEDDGGAAAAAAAAAPVASPALRELVLIDADHCANILTRSRTLAFASAVECHVFVGPAFSFPIPEVYTPHRAAGTAKDATDLLIAMEAGAMFVTKELDDRAVTIVSNDLALSNIATELSTRGINARHMTVPQWIERLHA